MSTEFLRQSPLPVSAETAFAWHARPGAFERLTPPWEDVRLVERTGGIAEGDRVVLDVGKGPFRKRWVAVHDAPEPGRSFRDRQLSGPFARWEHTHAFIPRGEHESMLEDRIRYALPLGALGRLAGGGFVRRQLDRMFAYRHRVTRDDLQRHADHPGPPLNIWITGSGGLVGSALGPFLTTGGHSVTRLVRRPPRKDDELRWDPTETFETGDRRADAVVHLAGAGIGDARWTPDRKRILEESRVGATRRLAEGLARARHKPAVLVCASAVGFYGDRPGAPVDESDAPGDGFLARLCQAWEEAARPAEEAGIRVVHLRFGMILSGKGGALGRMLLPFRLGLGGRLGSGRQGMSWVVLDDVLGAILHAVRREDLQGPVNVTAPCPVPNAVFTRVLGEVLHRPAVLPVPGFALRLGLGEMAEELLLQGAMVAPRRLEATGFRFAHPRLVPALGFVLGRPTPAEASPTWA